MGSTPPRSKSRRRQSTTVSKHSDTLRNRLWSRCARLVMKASGVSRHCNHEKPVGAHRVCQFWVYGFAGYPVQVRVSHQVFRAFHGLRPISVRRVVATS